MIKGLPDAALQKEAQNPSGQAPQFLVVSEIKRRKDMRERYAQNQQSQGTVKDQLLGMAPPAPQPQMASMGQPQGRPMPPMGGQMPMGQPPMQQPAPPMGMYGGGVIRMAEGLTVPQTREEQLAFLAGKSPEEIFATAAQLGLNANDLIRTGILNEDQMPEATVQDPDQFGARMAEYDSLIKSSSSPADTSTNPLDVFAAPSRGQGVGPLPGFGGLPQEDITPVVQQQAATTAPERIQGLQFPSGVSGVEPSGSRPQGNDQARMIAEQAARLNQAQRIKDSQAQSVQPPPNETVAKLGDENRNPNRMSLDEVRKIPGYENMEMNEERTVNRTLNIFPRTPPEVSKQIKALFRNNKPVEAQELANQYKPKPQRDPYVAMQGNLIKMPEQRPVGIEQLVAAGTNGVDMSGVGGAKKQMNNAQKEDSSRLKLDSLDESTINAALSDSSNAEREDQGKVNPRSLDSATIDMASNTANPDDKVATEQAKFVTYPEAMYGQKPPSPILSDEGRDAAEGLYSLLNKMTSGSGAGRSTEFISQAELRGRPVSEVQALMAQGWEKTLSGGLSREKPKNIETNAFDPELAGRLTGDEYSKENTPLGMLLNRKESNLVKLAEFAQQNPYAAERIRDAGGARSYLDLIESLDVNEGYKPSTFGTNRGGSEERPTGSRLDSILSEVAALDTSDKPVEVDPSLVASDVGSGKVGPKGRTSTDKSVDKFVQGGEDEESSEYKIPTSLEALRGQQQAIAERRKAEAVALNKEEKKYKELLENRQRPTLSYDELIRESEQNMATQLADIKDEKGTQALIALGAGIASGNLAKGLSDAGKSIATSNAQKRALEARQQAVRMGFRKSEVDAVYQNQVAKESDKLEGMKFSLDSLRRLNASTADAEQIVLNFDTGLETTLAKLQQSAAFKAEDRAKQEALNKRAVLEYVNKSMDLVKTKLIGMTDAEQQDLRNSFLIQGSSYVEIPVPDAALAGSTTSTASPATTTIGGYSVTQKQ